jgi:hypothetical protein
MRNFLFATVALCLFTPPACLFTPAAIAKADREMNGQLVQPDHQKKPLAVKGGTLLNSDATPQEAKKTAEATNRQVLEKRRKH